MNNWTFENDNGLNPKMDKIKEYVSDWETKEKEVAVRMTNFAAILNDLNSHCSDRNEYIQGLCRNRLLIIDNLGMERGTDYGLEQVYNVIDARYRSHKPLIITTNLTLNEMANEMNVARKRIYDRVLAMCPPIQIQGTHMRKIERENKFKKFIESKK